MKKYRKPIVTSMGSHFTYKPAIPALLGLAAASGAMRVHVMGDDRNSSVLPSLDKCLTK